MNIFHGTQPVNLSGIQESGIFPSGETGRSNWTQIPARTDLVYLTKAYPFFFGRKGGHPGILAVEVCLDALNPQLLLPDEDYIVQTGQVVGTENQSAHEIAKERLEEFQSQWQESLERLGTCAYKSVVPREALNRFCVLSMENEDTGAIYLWAAAFEVEDISLEYHAANGLRHRACTFWAFGDEPLPANVRWDGNDRSRFRIY